MSFLSVHHLSHSFGRHRVLDDVTFHLEPGRFACLLGPSGSGKTTLLRLVAGLDAVQQGTIALDGALLSGPGHHTPPEARGVGMVFQQPTLFSHLTTVQNIDFGLRRMTRDKAQRRIVQLLDMVGLNDRANHYPHQLSGGQQHRVALARAMAPENVRLLLLDEPFSHLDPALRAQIGGDARALAAQSGITCLMVTHDAHEAMRLADTLVLLDGEGRLHQTGSPRELYDRPKDAYAAQALGEVNLLPVYRQDGKALCALGEVAAGQTGQVGLRPHDIEMVANGGVVAVLEHIICSGAGDHLLLRLESGEKIAVSAPAGHGHRTGQTLHVRMKPGAAMVF